MRVQPISSEISSSKLHIHYGEINAASIPATTVSSEPAEQSTTSASPVQNDQYVSSSMRAHQQLLAAFEIQKAARAVPAPTLDHDVQARLRELGEPICLFGEGNYERRERLKLLLARQFLKQTGTQEIAVHVDASRVTQQKNQRLFFSQGGPALLVARKDIARFSLPRAVKRLRADKKDFGSIDPLEAEHRVASFNQMLHRKLEVLVSQIGSERPLSTGRFAPQDCFFATSSWAPTIRVWKVPSCFEFGKGYHGHTERVNSLSWNPLFKSTATKSFSHADLKDATRSFELLNEQENENQSVEFSDGWHFASGGFDAAIGIWNLTSETPLHLLKGHEERVNCVETHPSGNYLASTSHDETWRLWDINTTQELLVQEGHSTAVYGLRCHPDGSLLFTGDLGGIVRGWDLRTGRSVLPLIGHVKQVLAITINPWRSNQLATCSDDNTVRVWDIRKQRCIDTILAHDRLISEVVYEPVQGRFLMTTSYDNSIKIWNSTEFSCTATLIEHESRVMGGDISGDGQCLASVSFDRTFKLWTLTKELDEK